MASAKTQADSDIQDLLAIMAQLRDPDRGCPWDCAQDFRTIAPYTIEEAYEVADAIEREVPAALREELGDLLFQVVFHAQMAREREWFGFADVVAAICDKMTRRHPHVFGDEVIRDADAQTHAWEQHKARERAAKASADASVLDDIPTALPALMRAQKLQRRAARVGFDWPNVDGVLEKFAEELAELREVIAAGSDPAALADEVGDLLFTCVNLARHTGVDAETALRNASRKFTRRFQWLEAQLAAAQRTPESASAAELDTLWEQAKRATADGA